MSDQLSLFDTPETAWRREQIFAPPTPREVGAERGESCELKAEVELSFDAVKAGRDANEQARVELTADIQAEQEGEPNDAR